MVNVLAIVCMRNEAVHVDRCLNHFASDGIDVWVIDNGSTDGTRDMVDARLGRGVVGVSDLPWTGVFSLSDQLREKKRIVANAAHDWIVHADADEWLCSLQPGQTLREGIAQADGNGANCVNFHELTFVPLPGEDFCSPDYAALMTTYCFFQPSYPRLDRAWKREAGLDSSASGGHVMHGPVNRYACDFYLRHYIVLSEAHARSKYLDRTFSQQERASGWHGSRAGLSASDLRFRRHSCLKTLADPRTCDFDLSTPVAQHFWEWPA